MEEKEKDNNEINSFQNKINLEKLNEKIILAKELDKQIENENSKIKIIQQELLIQIEQNKIIKK